MAANTRNRTQRERDREQVAALHLQGLSHREIAEQLGVSRQQVTYDLKIIRELWKERAATAPARRREEMLAEFEYAKRAAWDAFRRSQEPKVRRKTYRRTNARGVDEHAEIVSENRPGDMRCVLAAVAVVAKLSEYLRLDAEPPPPVFLPYKEVVVKDRAHLDRLREVAKRENLDLFDFSKEDD
jgi:hypothetical protein